MSSLGRVQQAAVRLFAERGFAATGIREIGRVAGLNSGTLYHYAASKEELLAGIMRTGTQELLRAGRAALEYNSDPAVQLGRLVLAHIAMEAINPLTSRVNDREVHALTGDNHTTMVGLRDDYESLFQRVLERGARTGQFLIGDLPMTRIALIEMCNGVAHWYRPDGRLSMAEVQDHYLGLAGRLVGSREIGRAECGPPVHIPLLESEPREGGGHAEATP